MKLLKKLFVILFLLAAAQGWCQVGQSSSSVVPTGVIWSFGGDVAPAGFLLCQGQAISRTTYSNLFAVIGTRYGIGDNSTTFNIPNGQGIFLQGLATQTIGGIVFDGASGTPQVDKMQSHWHTVVRQADNASGGENNSTGGGQNSVAVGEAQTITAKTLITDGANGTPRTGTTTKPASVGVNFIIKL